MGVVHSRSQLKFFQTRQEPKARSSEQLSIAGSPVLKV